jgi:hypothetical protein
VHVVKGDGNSTDEITSSFNTTRFLNNSAISLQDGKNIRKKGKDDAVPEHSQGKYKDDRHLQFLESREPPFLISGDESISVGRLDHTKNAIPEQYCVTEEKQMDKTKLNGGVADSSPDSSCDELEDGEEYCVDPDVPRADWAPLRAIPEPLFREALLQHLATNHAITAKDIRCNIPHCVTENTPCRENMRGTLTLSKHNCIYASELSICRLA